MQQGTPRHALQEPHRKNVTMAHEPDKAGHVMGRIVLTM
jgi:hypothetical protein